MAQVVLFIDGERIMQRGMMAPKRNRSVRDWLKDAQQLFYKELTNLAGPTATLTIVCFEHRITETHIRIQYCGDAGKEVGLVIDRQANWT